MEPGPEETHDGHFWIDRFIPARRGKQPEAQKTSSTTFEKEGHMRQTKYRFLLLPLFFVLACVGAFAQANSEVTGIVTDQTGAVVAGAKITLTDPATGVTKSTISSGTGLYDIAGLNAANYNMKVTAKGFRDICAERASWSTFPRPFRVDVKLTVGAEAQTVTVEADALAVQGDSNVVSTLINEQQITELATNGRNVVGLAALGLGVSGNLPDQNAPTLRRRQLRHQLQRPEPGAQHLDVDGGEAYDRGSGGKMSVMPSQDALGEFQVLASNYPPDYGISSGGTITMSIKSGTQKFHGEAWEFDRNDALDAHNYFDNTPAARQEAGTALQRLRRQRRRSGVHSSRLQLRARRGPSSSTTKSGARISGNARSPINTIPSADLVTAARTSIRAPGRST